MGIESIALNTTATMMRADQNFGAKSVKDLMSPEDAKNLAAIEEKAKEFEAVFVTEMLKPMFDGIETDGKFGGGKGEEIFRGMMLEEYGKKLADNGGIGIAAHVKEQLLKIQENKAL